METQDDQTLQEILSSKEEDVVRLSNKDTTLLRFLKILMKARTPTTELPALCTSQ